MEQASSPETSTAASIALMLLGVMTTVLALAGDFFTLIEFGSGCSPIPDPEMMRQGRFQLVVIVLIAVTPWLVAGVRSRRRAAALVVIGVLAAIPPFVGALYGITDDSAWTGGLCIPF